MRNKKILALLLALILLLVACSPATSQKPKEEPEEVAVETEETTEEEEEVTVPETDTKSTEEKWAKVEETLSTYKYNEFVPFDENLVLKTDGRDAESDNGIVSTQKYEASKIGADIIAQGGNAVDAAVAASFALGVCEPNASGLGGGGFMTLRDGETGEVVYVDFREVAPLASTEDMYLDEDGEPVDEIKTRGGLSVAVPGEVAGLLYILEEYGTMSREEVLKPAIELAENGFMATPKFINTVVDAYDIMLKFPELGKIYLNDELPFEAGDLVKNPDLAKTLKIIAEKGTAGFYEGEVAEAIVKASENTMEY